MYKFITLHNTIIYKLVLSIRKDFVLEIIYAGSTQEAYFKNLSEFYCMSYSERLKSKENLRFSTKTSGFHVEIIRDGKIVKKYPNVKCPYCLESFKYNHILFKNINYNGKNPEFLFPKNIPFDHLIKDETGYYLEGYKDNESISKGRFCYKCKKELPDDLGKCQSKYIAILGKSAIDTSYFIKEIELELKSNTDNFVLCNNGNNTSNSLFCKLNTKNETQAHIFINSYNDKKPIKKEILEKMDGIILYLDVNKPKDLSDFIRKNLCKPKNVQKPKKFKIPYAIVIDNHNVTELNDSNNKPFLAAIKINSRKVWHNLKKDSNLYDAVNAAKVFLCYKPTLFSRKYKSETQTYGASDSLLWLLSKIKIFKFKK